ncbi:MAG: LuxR C-terminal-related transcriptional regulator [Bacteroidales bacterium]|nr:LuxR C-terminal-related transcriptional regulator [Bacteroidales bacterium]
MSQLNIGISTPSPLLLAGLMAQVKALSHSQANVIDATGKDLAEMALRRQISVAIIDMVEQSPASLQALKEQSQGRLKLVGLYHSALPATMTAPLDYAISIYDDASTISDMLRRLSKPIVAEDDDADSTRDLTPREQEIVKGVVMGLSNKEIASQMDLSVNTVTTHRRNIAAKLRIHSPAGLTIYALMQGLVSLDQVAPK